MYHDFDRVLIDSFCLLWLKYFKNVAAVLLKGEKEAKGTEYEITCMSIF